MGLLAGTVWAGGSTGLGKGVFLLPDLGSNSTALVTGDGLFLVDSGMVEQVGDLERETRALGARIGVLFNTHWHFDHTGGNVRVGTGGARIVAHENVRRRLSETTRIDFYKRTDRALPAVGRPGEVFGADGGAMTFGGERIRYVHYPGAHTDGDATVHFENADVLCVGDLFFNGMYPFVDYSTGGSLAGMIRAVEGLARVAGAGTRIVPGHGPVGGRGELVAFGEMLAGVRERVTGLMKGGRSLRGVKEGLPTREFDGKWGGGFFKGEEFVEMIYRGERGRAIPVR